METTRVLSLVMEIVFSLVLVLTMYKLPRFCGFGENCGYGNEEKKFSIFELNFFGLNSATSTGGIITILTLGEQFWSVTFITMLQNVRLWSIFCIFARLWSRIIISALSRKSTLFFQKKLFQKSFFASEKSFFWTQKSFFWTQKSFFGSEKAFSPKKLFSKKLFQKKLFMRQKKLFCNQKKFFQKSFFWKSFYEAEKAFS